MKTGIDNKVGIRVRDPTGLGTGLGLSLSYDIIKAHGVEI
jgi:signal transduction histidine kinase